MASIQVQKDRPQAAVLPHAQQVGPTQQGLDPADYLDTEQPKAVVLSRSRSFNTESGRVETMEMLDSSVRELTASFCNAERYGAYFEVHDASEMDEADWDAARKAWSDTMTFTLGARVTELPFGLNRSEYYGIYLVLPEETRTLYNDLWIELGL